MIKTTIHIPPEEMAALEALAKREDRSKASIIREAIGRYVTESCPPLPEAVGIFEDTEVDSTNLDDWLRENWHPE
jgi:hypothetical protein